MSDISGQDLIQFETAIAETHPIALIHQKYTELQNPTDLDFINSYDDLDDLSFASLDLPSGNKVALVDRKNSPVPGTEICVKPEQKDNVEIIKEVLATINLTLDDLTWVHPDYEEMLYGSSNLAVPSKEDLPTNYPQKFAGVDFSDCTLEGIDFARTNLQGAIFRKAKLSKANFQQSDLRDADLRDADLRETNFSQAKLKGANLSRANLQGAKLSEADFQRANLQGAILNDANLHDALFNDANLAAASLQNIDWNPKTMWFHVLGLHKAFGIPENLSQQPNYEHYIALSKAYEELKDNNIKEFRNLYKEVISNINDDDIKASLWNKLAWLSSLYGCPDDKSYDAAKEAINLSEKDKGNYHDTLGLIYALREDFDSALNEFKQVLDKDDTKTWSSSFRARREKWIAALQIGENPFTEEELSILRNFEY